MINTTLSLSFQKVGLVIDGLDSDFYFCDESKTFRGCFSFVSNCYQREVNGPMNVECFF